MTSDSDIVYRYIADDAHYEQAFAHYFRMRPLVLRQPFQSVFSALPLLAVWLYGKFACAPWAGWMGPLLLCYTLLIAVLLILGREQRLRRLRKLPGFGREVAVTLSGQGVAVRHPLGQSESQWAMLPQSARFADGLALIRGRMLIWLPDSALREGTAAQATQLVESMTKMRRLP